MSGRIVHFEIPFDDGDRARAFYRDVFGWKTDEMPEMQYTMAITGPVGDDGMSSEPGYINGGMFQRQADVPVPVLTIAVDSIDSAFEEIESHGGSRSGEKIQVGDMGFAAYFKDSEGNLIGLWENAG
jgi:predicted enzyme related to lactoylglutathione lyase